MQLNQLKLRLRKEHCQVALQRKPAAKELFNSERLEMGDRHLCNKQMQIIVISEVTENRTQALGKTKKSL